MELCAGCKVVSAPVHISVAAIEQPNKQGAKARESKREQQWLRKESIVSSLQDSQF
jgi:hypothetical protein